MQNRLNSRHKIARIDRRAMAARVRLIGRLCFAVLSVALLTVTVPPGAVSSQASTAVGDWTEPVNLSQTGSTTSPQLIIDSDDRFHAIWLDAFDGYVVTESRDAVAWSIPKPVSFPFDPAHGRPLFVPVDQGLIYAFWLDNNGTLLTSFVTGNDFADGAAWQSAVSVADFVVDFDVASTSSGTIHLVYVVGAAPSTGATTQAAGVYQSQASEGDTSWSDPETLYVSPYLRSVTANMTNIDVTAAGSRLFVVWDNQPLRRILFSRSLDDGNNWTTPTAPEGPSADVSAATPHNGTIIVLGEELLLVWQSATGAACALNSRTSSDQGISWGPAISVIPSMPTCPLDNRFVSAQEGTIVVASSLAAQVLLVAWNGREWSDPQAVPSSAINADTLEIVSLGCQQLVASEESLYAISCSQGGADVWLSARSVPVLDEWFPLPTQWIPSALVTMSQAEIGPIALAANEQGAIDALWVERSYSGGAGTSVINAAQWDGQRWSQPASVISAQEGEINDLQAAMDGQRLAVVWSEAVSGQIYYSWANFDRIGLPAEWATPVALVPRETAAASPSLLVQEPGVLLIMYAVSLNENRGIYLLHSDDEGETWAAPVKVFDAVEANWIMTGGPSLAGGSGWLNAVWFRYPLPQSQGPSGLAVGRSQDGGTTWADVTEIAEGPIRWAVVKGLSGTILHRMWQINEGDESIVWHQFSEDAGATWSAPASITGVGPYVGTPAAELDAAGQLHLLLARHEQADALEVHYWSWADGGWTSQGSVALRDTDSDSLAFLSAVAAAPSELMVVYPGTTADPTTGNSMQALYFSSRSVEMPAAAATRLAVTAVASTATSQPEAIDELTVTATASPASVAEPTHTPIVLSNVPAATESPWSGVVLGGTVVAVLIAGVLSFRVILLRRH